MKTGEIAKFLNGELRGNSDAEIAGIADISSAGIGQLTFLDKTADALPTKATCILVSPNRAVPETETTIVVSDPKLSFARVATILSKKEKPSGIAENAALAASAKIDARYIGPFVSVGDFSNIGSDCEVHAGTNIGRNVAIGKGTVIYPNSIIYDGVSIGENCIIHAGTVIGADGFGYVRDEDGNYLNFPQIGTVVIEDFVEIGASTCIDRGALGETRIGSGTKIDNLVQIAHNVQIGKRCVIASQTGISGSTIIEDDCVIGGQVGFGDHVRVQSGAIIGSQAGVLPGKIVRPGVWWGTPIQPLEAYKRQNAHVKGLARLKAEVKKIQDQIAELRKD